MKLNSRSKDKTKRLFKFAYLNQPQSIRSLKRSLSISNSNIETFAKSIGYFTSGRINKQRTFNRSSHKSEVIQEQAEDRITETRNNVPKMLAQRKQIADEIAVNRIKVQARTRNKMISKSFKLQSVSHKDQLITDQQTKKKMQPLHCSQYQFVLPKSAQKILNSTKRQYWHINEPKNRNYRTPINKNRTQNNSQNQRNASTTQRLFGFSREKANRTKVVHYKTEPNQKGAEKLLSYLTTFDNSKNNKALNCLVLQLQLNLQVQKKVKNKTFN